MSNHKRSRPAAKIKAPYGFDEDGLPIEKGDLVIELRNGVPILWRAGGPNSDSLPAPEVLAAEIVDDLEAAVEQFAKIAARLRPTKTG